MIPAYTVTYSPRRTMVLLVTGEGMVEVRAPLGTSPARIRTFLEEKERWLAQKQAAAQARCHLRDSFSLEAGQTISILGQERSICLGPPDCRPLLGEDKLLLPQGSPQQRAAALESVCRRLARDFLPRRVQELSAAWGLACTGVTITNARTRWGSCNGKNHLSFSLRLLYADPATVDYVICHELAHTRCHNHSPDFWALVGRLMPDYPLREQALRALQQRLFIQNC